MKKIGVLTGGGDCPCKTKLKTKTFQFTKSTRTGVNMELLPEAVEPLLSYNHV